MLIQTILKTNRINHHFTQEQIAEKLHITTQAISKWENGQSIPSIDNLVLLSDLYNVSIDELVQGSPFFKKPRIVGKTFNYKKGILFLISWILIALFLTGFGYQPLWVFILVMLIGIVLVLPTIFSDYWIIDQKFIEIHQFDHHPLLKIIELITGLKNPQRIPYTEIDTFEIIYNSKVRLSPFDLNPDYFYVAVNYHNQTIDLNLDTSPKEFLPQFASFLSRQGIQIVDKSNIITLLVTDTPLYEQLSTQKNSD
ncbi:helix-turn-helix domain-containing protein [Lapidilactobacillus bayanensis]|uniref:helix-turn-helix domain-containing protein n=1 Tax=Lapidilactobacillus bayanensis TaxID=2485998 RepID=UPI000F770AF4|nr:helix-turn-helix transcriptional regulator [Lapidilactobacillus bayanensis]